MTKRLFASLIAGVSAVALTACTPALENPSEEKVPTAQEQDPDSLAGIQVGYDLPDEYVPDNPTDIVGVSTPSTTVLASQQSVSFVDCVAAPAEQPEQVTVDCANPVNSVVGIEWTAWGEEETVGVGTDSTTGAESEIVLSELTETPDGLMYNSVTIDGVTVTP